MVRACPACRFDPGFEAIVCPRCGAQIRAGARPAQDDPVAVSPSAPTVPAPARRAPSDHSRTILASDATMVDKRTAGRACLIALSGPDSGRQFMLEDISTVGRSMQATVSLRDPRVSERHAQVKWTGGQFIYQDLQATNGSFLVTGGRRRRLRGVHALKDDDEIEIGETVLRFFAIEGGGRR